MGNFYRPLKALMKTHRGAYHDTTNTTASVARRLTGTNVRQIPTQAAPLYSPYMASQMGVGGG